MTRLDRLLIRFRRGPSRNRTHGSLILVATGVVVGLIAAAALTRVLEGLLYGVTALDPLTFVTVSITLLVAGAAAAAIPAARAARLDPVQVLTAE